MTTIAEMIEVTVNGDPRQVPPDATVSDLIAILGLNPQLVAVEINRELVRKSMHQQRRLVSGDRVEVVEFVGGG